MTEQALPFAEIVQPILTEERRLDLSPRDIALLATIKVEIERNPDGLLSIPYSAIQGLSSRIDLLDVRDPQKAEVIAGRWFDVTRDAQALFNAVSKRSETAGQAHFMMPSSNRKFYRLEIVIRHHQITVAGFVKVRDAFQCNSNVIQTVLVVFAMRLCNSVASCRLESEQRDIGIRHFHPLLGCVAVSVVAV